MTHNIDYRFERVRGGIKVGELYAEGDATITMQRAGAVKTDFSGVFCMDPDFNILTDRIRPMYCRDGVWTPMGLFAVNDSSDQYVDGHGLIQVSALDMGHFVERKPAEARPYFQKGELYTEIILQMLDECGVTRVRFRDSPLRLRTDREDWEVGTSYLTMINQLLSEINYDDLWFDADGYARVDAVDLDAPAMHQYRADDHSVIACEYEKTLDVNGAYNVFKAYVTSADALMVAQAENDDPASAISTARIGRNVLLEKLDNIASYEELENYVRLKRNQSMSGTERVTFTTQVERHGVGDTVYLQHHGMQGVYRETGWTVTFGGEMTHTAERVVSI